jgi:hypothetical protein
MADGTLDLGALDDKRAQAEQMEPARRAPARPRLAGRTWPVDRLLLAASVLMIPGGVAAILLGWYGAARTPFLFEQVPYLISGGLLGVGLLLGGGLLYMGSWLSRLAAQQRDDAAQLRELLGALRAPETGGPVPVPPLGGGLVATPTGTMFHRPDCPVVAGKSGLRQVGSDNGLSPCKLCDPVPA